MPRLRWQALFASILGALVLGASGSAAASGAGGERAAASESAVLSPCDLNAGPRFRCGRIAVPAVRRDPSIGDHCIFFAVLPRDRAARPTLGTIVAVEGGPGYASTNFE